jgi:type II secretory ATPase GspE/PulE/Tfp pilus assembly ATPase PilB-like protein
MLNTPGVNISTIEDPVEYRAAGVNQTQVNPKAGMTFASGLRALLRQDPNVIMVGEIRDGETADLGVQAALTGHVVLSTLHTNNAATALPRLLDMGIEPFLIASTVNTIIGQRLVRRLCPQCRVPYIPEGAVLSNIKRDFDVEGGLKYLETISTAQLASPTTSPSEPDAPEPAEEEDAHPKSKKKKVIEPLHKVDGNKSILDKIASDPNILNRSADEAKSAKEQKDAEEKAHREEEASKLRPLKNGEFMLYKPGEGCERCGGNTYQGRMGIYEVLEVDPPVQQMITSHATSEQIQESAIKSGMLTMQMDGFVKALRGQTTLEEILRVTRE